jgi:hypothetical protein
MTRVLALLFSLGVIAVAASAAGQDTKQRRVPPTGDGRPDLSGVWNFSSGVPLQRPAAFAGRKVFTKEEFDNRRVTLFNALAAIATFMPVENVGFDWIDTKLYVDDFRTSLITYPDNGRLPALVEGVRRVPGPEDILAALADAKGGLPPELLSILAAFAGGPKNSHTDFNASERCLDVSSPPLVPQIGENYMQIVQARDHLAFVSDIDRRIVALDGRPSASGMLRSGSGTSSGRWEGDTLVVETRNFNNRTPSFAGAGNALGKMVTERFTRTSAGIMQYSVTIVDPKTFTDRIELSFPMARVNTRIFESACHEGNYSLANTLSAVRKEEAEARKSR